MGVVSFGVFVIVGVDWVVFVKLVLLICEHVEVMGIYTSGFIIHQFISLVVQCLYHVTSHF